MGMIRRKEKRTSWVEKMGFGDVMIISRVLATEWKMGKSVLW
jgi:hypothetical protein